MLDVHPPHNPTHTWRDFFLHIATIVVGLLIAVGLEQAVELLHHRHVLSETRENLHHELNEESEVIQSNLDIMHAEQKELRTDADILRGTAHNDDKLIYRWGFSAPRSIAWTSAKSNNTTALISSEEVERYSYVFFLREHVTEISASYIDEGYRQGHCLPRSRSIRSYRYRARTTSPAHGPMSGPPRQHD